jgi:hypothetical protein
MVGYGARARVGVDREAAPLGLDPAVGHGLAPRLARLLAQRERERERVRKGGRER